MNKKIKQINTVAVYQKIYRVKFKFIIEYERLCFKKEGFTEGELSENRKHVWFFAYNLRMERGTVLMLTSLSALCQ